MARAKHGHAWSVGIDLHKDTLVACVYCAGCGEISYHKFYCKCREQIAEFFAGLPRPHVVAIETVGFYRWLWELLEPLVERLVLADATGARALAGRRLKTDREDAFNVAELLSAGRLPLAYAPPAEVQELRDWTRHRNGLSRQHARVLHRVQSLMNLDNRPGPARLEAAGLIRYLKGFADRLPPRHATILWKYVEQLTLLERQLDEAERELRRLLDGDTFRAPAEILRTIPGVGPIVAATVLAEVGDFSRFTHRKAVARYAGLNPRLYASGGKQRDGHIAKAGPPDLRWALQQAAWTAIRCDPAIKKQWLRISRQAGKKAAAVAIARKLLTWMWHMIRSGETYRSPAQAA
ncbi:MAG TPA: IS110 family transposase [Polyangia bacterium]|nr:IS110 family transposase [Polyangia bacterium]